MKRSHVTRVVLALSIAIVPLTLARAGTLTLPAGSPLHVILETTLTTKTNKVGDPFRARLMLPVFADGRRILPVGTVVEGTIVSLKKPGRIKGKAQMQLRPDKLILPDGRDIGLSASLEGARGGDGTALDPKEGTIKAGGKGGMSGRRVGAGAAAGAGVGAAVGGGKGAGIGAAAVGAVALFHHLFKRGRQARLPVGTELVLEVDRSVSFSDMQPVPPASPQKAPVPASGAEQAP